MENLKYDKVLSEIYEISSRTKRLVDSIDEPLTKKQAAIFLNVSEKELEKFMTRSYKPLPYKSSNNRLYLLRSDIIKWVKNDR